MTDDPTNVVALRPGIIGADQLGREGPVLVVDGAAAQQYASKRFVNYVVIATSGDIDTTDFSPLADRLVTIWPSNSDEGRRRARALSHRIVAAKAAMVRVVKTETLPSGWNLGGEVPPGVDLWALVGNAAGIEDQEEVTRLAQLDPLSFDREKKAAATRLGVSMHALDLAVKIERRRQQEAAAAAAIAVPLPPEPWKEPVDGAGWLGHAAKQIRRFIAVKPELADAVALWCLGVHALPAFDIFPRLLETSYSPESGKTTLLHLIGAVVPRPSLHDDATAASIYRSIDPSEPRCFLLDEMDNVQKFDRLSKVLRSGHRRHGNFTLWERGREKQYWTFAPIALAMIGEPGAAIASRCIWLRLERRRPDEAIEPFDPADPPIAAELSVLLRQGARWAEDNVVALRASPRPATTLISRARDNWLPLLKISHLVGGGWPERCSKAAALLEADRGEGALYDDLARDIGKILKRKKRERISADELARELLDAGNPRWSVEKLSKNKLAYLLRPVRITPRPMRFSSTRIGQGYEVEDFADFLARHGRPRKGGK
jgi:hypothetical protein